MILEHRGLGYQAKSLSWIHVLTLAIHQNNLWSFLNLFLNITDAWASPKTLIQYVLCDDLASVLSKKLLSNSGKQLRLYTVINEKITEGFKARRCHWFIQSTNMVTSYRWSGTVLGTNGYKCKQNSKKMYNLHIHANSELKSMINIIVLWEHIGGSSWETISFIEKVISKLGPEG